MGCEIFAYLQLGTIAGPKHRKYPVLPEYAFRSRRKAGSEGERLHDREVDPQVPGSFRCVDFNVDQRSESYRELVKTGFLTDSFEAAPIRMAATGTVNGFDPQRWTGQRIDHVLVTRGIEVLRYGLLTNPYWSVDCAGNREARLPSDHYPVSVYLTIP